MERLTYNRSYLLTVGLPPEYIAVPTVDSPVENFGGTFFVDESQNYRTIEVERAIEITDLHMEAAISTSSKTGGSNNTNCKISIYNLSEESIAKVSKQNSFIILQAGYSPNSDDDASDLSPVFYGQVKKAETEYKGADLVTTLYCGDGYTPSNSVRVNLKVAGGQLPIPFQNAGSVPNSYEDVFSALIKAWRENGISSSDASIQLSGGLPYQKPVSEFPLSESWVFQGNLRDAMDEVCSEFNFVWYILNGNLFIHPKSFREFQDVIEINPNQIKSIRPSQEQVRESSTSEVNVGVKLKTFLDGNIRPSKLIRITSGEFEGTYTATSVMHDLSYRGKLWDTTAICEVVK